MQTHVHVLLQQNLVFYFKQLLTQLLEFYSLHNSSTVTESALGSLTITLSNHKISKIFHRHSQSKICDKSYLAISSIPISTISPVVARENKTVKIGERKKILDAVDRSI